jgi:acyl-CoA reductase-like NAD-dependent aldehyde dehydrogenase
MKITSTDPSSNYNVLGEVEAASEADVVEAIQQARAAQPAWANLSLSDRCKKIESFMNICESRTEDIAKIMTVEMGKPIKASRVQVTEALEYFTDYIRH